MRIEFVDANRLQAIADLKARRFSRDLRKVWNAQAARITTDVMDDLIHYGVGHVQSEWEAEITAVFNKRLLSEMLDAWAQAGSAAANGVNKLKARNPYLDSENYQQGIRYIAARGAELVKETTSAQAEVIRGVLRAGITKGLGIEEMRDMIRRSVGLLGSQVETLERTRSALLEQGMTPAHTEKLVMKYRNQMLDYRAERIARTEISKVVHKAQDEVVKSAMQSGEISPNTQRVWMTAESDRTCDECAALDGQVIGVESDMMPPLHPNCMCTIGYEITR